MLPAHSRYLPKLSCDMLQERGLNSQPSDYESDALPLELSCGDYPRHATRPPKACGWQSCQWIPNCWRGSVSGGLFARRLPSAVHKTMLPPPVTFSRFPAPVASSTVGCDCNVYPGAGLFRAGRAAPRTKDNFTRPAFAAARNILSNPTGSYLSYRLGTGND